ncbi:MAG TPA: ABC transporter permease [Bryobacteraceae bacterium]|nr:ABC transporter permease [Bryobacteraceae bacterium]
MGFLSQDFRFGVRVLAREPLVAGSIILILGLGIGANSAMFTIVDALLLHAVRYPDPQTLVFVWSHDSQGAPSDVSAADFMDWRVQSKTLSDLAAWMPTSFVVTGGERPRQLGGARVTANFFRTLRVKPVLGRTFLPDEDGLEHPENAARSVVIGYRFWQEDLGADPEVLGRTIRVDSIPYTIIGVAPENFQFWWRPHDLWVPVSLNVHDRDYRDLVVIARLAGTRARAAAEMAVISRSLGEAYPKSDKGWTVQLDELQDWLLNRTFRTRILILSAAVGLVLLIACTNVASLLLARSAVRARELAVRVSLGATRSRLVRQLLTESALLALAGGGLGLAIAWALVRLAPKFVPANAIPGGPLELSAPVVWFTLAVSAVTCILFGLAPAVAAARGDVQTALKDSGRGSTGGRKRLRFRQVMVAAEIAIALMLLSTTWLMIGSLRGLTRIDPGFNPKNVLAVRMYLPAAKYDAEHALGFYRLALERISALPGVQTVTVGTSLPPQPFTMEVRFEREGMPSPGEAQLPSAAYASVGADYFRTLDIPLRRGRSFTEADNETAPRVAILNQAFVARYYPGEDPIGRRILVNRPLRFFGEEQVQVEIVGVVGDLKLIDLSVEPTPAIYVPHSQNPFSRAVWFAARTGGDPLALGAAVRKEFLAIDREQPIEQVGTLEGMLTGQFAQPRFQAELMSLFALMALILASAGIYGVSAYSVAQRRSEIGLRMALGASPRAVLGEMIRQGLRLIVIGVAAGMAGAEALSFWLRSALVGAGRPDPMAMLGAAAMLGIVATLACYFPARKATRIDPAIALRAE